MAYLGKGLKSISTANITVDKMTGNGSTTTMGISLGNQIGGSINDINVYISGVHQRPGTDYTLSGSTITFTTAPANGWSVVAVSKGDSIKDDIIDSSVTSESIKDGAVTNAKITSVSSSKLTGALPALDGSALTGIVTYTESANDPSFDTNPSGGTGTIWVNKTSGQMYVCIDATAGDNVWANVGDGDGDVRFFSLQGENYGFTSGGQSPNSNVVQKYYYSSNENATDHGDLTVARAYAGGHSSSTHGYTSGGDSGGMSNVIDKFGLTSLGNATDVGNLTQVRDYVASHSSETYGYTSAGGTSPFYDIIDRFSFSTDGNATDVGDTLTTLYGATGCSSSTHGYVVGGANSSHAQQNVIQKFSLAASANTSDIGDLETARYQHSSNGINSSTHGYSCGGFPLTTSIEKFSFSTDGNASAVATLTVARQKMGATTSTTHGYNTGGRDVGGNPLNVIDKFNHTTDANATDVGDLTVNLIGPTGQQY